MAKDLTLYTDHILEAIANIEEDIAGLDFERFRADRRARQLVERNLEIISEASRRLPSELKEAEHGIPWNQIAGFGNVLRHEYHRTQLRRVWETCQTDLAPVKAATLRIRERIAADRGRG